jgi:hypothetical protein
MAVKKEYTLSTTEAPIEVETPAVDVPVEAVRPTLKDAFYVLCTALEDTFEDNLADQLHANEIQRWMDDGGTNAPIAWKHAALLLERALGHDLFTR